MSNPLKKIITSRNPLIDESKAIIDLPNYGKINNPMKNSDTKRKNSEKFVNPVNKTTLVADVMPIIDTSILKPKK